MTTPLVDTNAAALAAGVTPSTIRTWAHRGHLTPQGKDSQGRTLYPLHQVLNRIHPPHPPTNDTPTTNRQLDMS